MIYLFNRFQRLKIGAKVKHIPRKDGKGIWCYLERGNQQHHQIHVNNHKKNPIMVFVHGIGTNKDSWIPVWKKMASNYHCIALDLPGNSMKILIKFWFY
jgi:pimeloyl-ACP methyl ester carboxylesterase